MTINKTISSIGEYGAEIDTQVKELACFTQRQLRTVSELGSKVVSADLLASVVAHQVDDAAARLKAVYSIARRTILDKSGATSTAEKVIDVTEYKEVPDEGS